MSVQIIENEGKPEYAVLPYAEYLNLVARLEDKEDMATAYQLKKESVIMNGSRNSRVGGNGSCGHQ